MQTPSFSRVAGAASFLATLIWFFFLFLGERLAWSSREEFLALHEQPLLAVRGTITMACFVFSIVALTGLHVRVRGRGALSSLAALLFFVAGTTIDAVFRGVEWLTVHATWARAYSSATDEGVRAALLSKIELFEDVGTGVALAFGVFFAAGNLLFAACTRRAHRALSLAFLLAGLFVAVAYSAALFASSPVPGWWWTCYEVLEIFLYVTLGVWLIRDEAASGLPPGDRVPG